MRSLTESKIDKWKVLTVVVIALIMFCLNIFTPLVADDWVYMSSFATNGLIQHIWDIFPSMYVHSFRMNGRVVSHGLLQFTFLFPRMLFCIVNALFFVALIIVSDRICTFNRKNDVKMIPLIMMGLWCFQPDFGQVFLWRCGSVNYLWALLFGVLYIMPFHKYYMGGSVKWGKAKIIGFSIFAFIVGFYTEITSFAVICLSVFLIISSVRNNGLKTWLWIPSVCAALGYVTLLKMPSEMNAKMSENSTGDVLTENIGKASDMLLEHMWVLILIWVLLAVIALVNRIDGRRLWLSFGFAIAAVGANYMLSIAAYYPTRCMSTTCLFLVIANGILIEENCHGRLEMYKYIQKAFLILFTCIFLLCFVIGVSDIYDCYTKERARDSQLKAAAAANVKEVSTAVIHGKTGWSVYHDIADLNSEESDTWPNNQIEAYYGVVTINGIE